MTSPRQPTHPVDVLFTGRWSPRAFTGEAMPPDVLMTMFEAARWAPSASNIQPWRFVFAPAGSAGFDGLLATLVPFNQDWAKRASALVVVVSARLTQGSEPGSSRPNRSHSFDAGAAWASLAFQAHRLGWCTHAMGGYDDGALRQALQLSDDFAIEAVVAVGRQGDAVSLTDALRAREHPNDRRPLAELVSDFTAAEPIGPGLAC